MPLRKTELVSGEFYHIINRGVEERVIFQDDEDRLRFINALLVFNDIQSTKWGWRGFWSQRDPSSLVKKYEPSKRLVEIHAFVLMPNHFHLLIRQKVENGIVLFMRKLGGYCYYFNKKYNRRGSLLQGRYKAILIKHEDQLRNNFVYIHTNPIELIECRWKEWQVVNFEKAKNFIEQEYKWSSYQDYLGNENFPRVITKEFFVKLFGGEGAIKESVDAWIKFKHLNFDS
ncbi:transposase [bacterium]|nr:transposase [bacterium]